MDLVVEAEREPLQLLKKVEAIAVGDLLADPFGLIVGGQVKSPRTVVAATTSPAVIKSSRRRTAASGWTTPRRRARSTARPSRPRQGEA